MGGNAAAAAGGAGREARRAAADRRAEHLLPAGVRAVRRRSLGTRSRRGHGADREPPVSESRSRHAGDRDARHPLDRPDLPPGLLARRRRPPSGAPHGDPRRRRRERPLPRQPGARAARLATQGLRPRPVGPPLRAAARRGRQVPAPDLAVPLDARRDRARDGLARRGGGVLPLHRAPVADAAGDQGPPPADRELLGAAARGRAGRPRPAARAGEPRARRAPAGLRRDPRRRRGQEPLRRLDGRGPARGDPRPGRGARAQGGPARRLRVARRGAGRRRLHGRRGSGVRALRGRRHAARELDRRSTERVTGHGADEGSRRRSRRAARPGGSSRRRRGRSGRAASAPRDRPRPRSPP